MISPARSTWGRATPQVGSTDISIVRAQGPAPPVNRPAPAPNATSSSPTPATASACPNPSYCPGASSNMQLRRASHGRNDATYDEVRLGTATPELAVEQSSMYVMYGWDSSRVAPGAGLRLLARVWFTLLPANGSHGAAAQLGQLALEPGCKRGRRVVSPIPLALPHRVANGRTETVEDRLEVVRERRGVGVVPV
jgi:hypothetical protein